MKSVFFRVVTGLAALSLVACAAKNNLNPPTLLSDLKQTISVKKVWSENATEGLGKYYLQLRPYYDSERIFVADSDGSLSALKYENGDSIWKNSTGLSITAGVNGGDSVVFVGTENGQVMAFSVTDGAPVWQQSLSSQVSAISKADEGILVARTGDGYIYGLASADGRVLWKHLRKTPALSLHTQSEPLLTRGVAFVGLDSGELLMIALAEGRVLWEKAIALGRGRTELDRLVDIDGQLAISDGVIYVSSYQGKLAAIDAAKGRVLWLEDLSSVSGLTVDEKTLYVTDQESVVWARDKRTGAALWKQEDLKFRRLTAPTIDGSRISVADFEGYMHWLDSESGRLVGRARADKEGVLSAPVAINDSLVVLGQSGQLSRWSSR